ncbi:MAG: error-prone DNA polymerase, partial [Alphaproteobacteria bacterium PA3]
MPEGPLTPDKRTLDIDPAGIAEPERAPFVELGLASCFSFLRGASDAVDLVLAAHAAGYDAIAIADVNSMAGVVRIHTEARTLKLRPVIGCRIETVEGFAFLAYPEDRAAYGRLCRLISAGRMRTPEGEWQDKGVCQITLAMLGAHSEGVQLILLPPDDLEAKFSIQVPSNVVPFRRPGDDPEPLAASDPDLRRDDERELAFPDLLPHLVRQLPTLMHIAAAYLYRGDDIARIERLDELARAHGLGLLATNDVHYHAPERRALQDVMTAIRHKTTVARAGHLLHPNAERHLKNPAQMQRLFARWPHAIRAAREVADACQFSLDELRYEYPEEIHPDGQTPQAFLEGEVWKGAARRYPANEFGSGVPDTVRATLERELALITKLDLARYFLTIKDIVDFARGSEPPILSQGQGSAA